MEYSWIFPHLIFHIFHMFLNDFLRLWWRKVSWGATISEMTWHLDVRASKKNTLCIKHVPFECLHSRNLYNIDTKMSIFEGRYLFQTIILGIHVSFRGCIYSLKSIIPVAPGSIYWRRHRCEASNELQPLQGLQHRHRRIWPRFLKRWSFHAVDGRCPKQPPGIYIKPYK